MITEFVPTKLSVFGSLGTVSTRAITFPASETRDRHVYVHTCTHTQNLLPYSPVGEGMTFL